MGEIWRPIPRYEGWYEASDLGRIRSVDRSMMVNKDGIRPYRIRFKSKILKPSLSNGYHAVTLWREHVRRTCKVGTFVLEAFVGPRPDGFYVCHRNGKPTDNRLSNLYYGTPSQNVADARRHGTLRVGSKISWSKLTEADVREIKSLVGQVPQSQIAKRFGVFQSQISRISRGEQWKHVA